MIRIWAKILREEKILKDMIYEQYETFDIDNFQTYMEEICGELDIATPIVLTKHIKHYVCFNNAVFLPSDFAESVDFDKLVIEEASL